MLDHLDENHGLSEHFKDPSADFWSRLSSDASKENLYEYYLKSVTIDYSADSGSINLMVRAFSAEKAQALANAIISESEKMVNDMSTRAHADKLQFIQKQVTASEDRLAKARKAIVDLQVEGKELSPIESASAVLGVRAELEAELAKAKAELSALLSVMTAEAPKVRAQRQRVRSLQGQVRAQSKRLVDNDGASINESIADFEPLLFEKEVAQTFFETSLRTLELTRTELIREQRYLVTISAPSRPDAATRPRRLWGIATVFFSAFVLMGVFGMLGAAVREHANY
jgi:capsular polysaccharide transport system permease protein